MTRSDGGHPRLEVVLATSVGSAGALLATAPWVCPPSATWTGLEEWYEEAGPAPAAAGLVWAAAGLVTAWLVVACVLELIARHARGPGWRTLADRVAPAALRGIATASLTAGLTLSTPAGSGADAAPGTATLHPVGAEEVTTSPSPVVTSTAPAPTAPADASLEEYTVMPGDSFWTIATDQLTELGPPGGRPNTPLDYWRRLMAANADRLVDAGNPDLLYAGQVLVLPPLT